METKQAASDKKPLPYVSYATFSNALESIVEVSGAGLPPQIDRSVLTQLSGLNQSLALNAFRYLGLVNDKNEPTAKFKEYAVETDPEKRKGILGMLIKEKYPNQVKLLTNGTYQLLKESFDTDEVPTSVKSKCLSFFFGAAKAAGYTISPLIVKGMNARTPRRDTGIKKRGKAGGATVINPFDDEDETEYDGMVHLPISIGVGKTWEVIVSEDYDKDDVKKFCQIIEITLGDGKKK